MRESTTVTAQLIRNIDKFDGTDFVTWERTLRAMANLVRPKLEEILDGQLRPEPLYRTRRGCDRSTTRGVTTSNSALGDPLEGQEPTPGGENGECGGRHEEIPSVTVLSTVIATTTDERILAKGAELKGRSTYNKQHFGVLLLSIKSTANSFFLHFTGRLNSSNQHDGQTTWKAMTSKYPNSSMQRWRIFMRELNTIVIMRNQDPDEYLTEIFQQQDKLEYVVETFTEARILDLILESLSDNFSQSDSPPSGTPKSR